MASEQVRTISHQFAVCMPMGLDVVVHLIGFQHGVMFKTVKE